MATTGDSKTVELSGTNSHFLHMQHSVRGRGVVSSNFDLHHKV